MNACFYIAIDRLPLGTVAAIEFLPVIALAALGARTPRNVAALALAVPGVYLLTDVQLALEPLGLAFAFANALLFALYIVLADRVAKHPSLGGIDGLGAAMLIALVCITPIGGWQALPALRPPSGAARRHRRRRQLVGDPLRRRPARARPPGARDVRADGGAAARHGDRDRRSSCWRRSRPVRSSPASGWSSPGSPCTASRAPSRPSRRNRLRVRAITSPNEW